jgi:hypothetical protein
MDSNDDGSGPVYVVYTAQEILFHGLLMAGYSKKRIWKAKHTTNDLRFLCAFGINQVAMAEVWEDLQACGLPKATIPPNEIKLECLLYMVWFLWKYETELTT